jgi:hypothetical protein
VIEFADWTISSIDFYFFDLYTLLCAASKIIVGFIWLGPFQQLRRFQPTSQLVLRPSQKFTFESPVS